MTEAVAVAPEQQQPQQVNLEAVIAKYVELRDSIEQANKELADRIAPIQSAMKGIETYLMALANQTGQTQFGTKAGVAFVTTKTGCNIADKDAYWRFLMDAPEERRHLLTLSANKTSVGEYIEKQGTPPPGINWTVMKAIQVRRA
jgi:hypothetical protein